LPGSPVTSAFIRPQGLAAYKGGKGTVQFPLGKPLPLGLIKRIVKFRMKANEEKAALKKLKKVKAANS
jgi:uncharacterized protein YdhG (YjbR/CyaY superfamily)